MVNHMTQRKYKLLLKKEEEGGYTVIVPSLPGCFSFGATIEEAIKMGQEAIELYIETLMDLGEEIPTDENTIEMANSSFLLRQVQLSLN